MVERRTCHRSKASGIEKEESCQAHNSAAKVGGERDTLARLNEARKELPLEAFAFTADAEGATAAAECPCACPALTVPLSSCSQRCVHGSRPGVERMVWTCSSIDSTRPSCSGGNCKTGKSTREPTESAQKRATGPPEYGRALRVSSSSDEISHNDSD